jgi:hypothetical protein
MVPVLSWMLNQHPEIGHFSTITPRRLTGVAGGALRAQATVRSVPAGAVPITAPPRAPQPARSSAAATPPA